MPRASATRELLASREDVWAFVAEPHHFPDWWPGVAAVEPDRRGLAEGARWHVHGKDQPTLLAAARVERNAARHGGATARTLRLDAAAAITSMRSCNSRRRARAGQSRRSTSRRRWLYGFSRSLAAQGAEPACTPCARLARSSKRLAPSCSISATTSRHLPRSSSRSSSASSSVSALASHGLGNTERKRLEEDLRRAESQSRCATKPGSTALTPDRFCRARLRRRDVQERHREPTEGKEDRVALRRLGSSDDRRSSSRRRSADAGAGSATAIHGAQAFRSIRRSLEKALAKQSVPRRTTPVPDAAQEPRSGARTGVRRREGHAAVERAAESNRRGDDRAVQAPGRRRRDRPNREAADRSDRRLPPGALCGPRGRRRSR